MRRVRVGSEDGIGRGYVLDKGLSHLQHGFCMLGIESQFGRLMLSNPSNVTKSI